MVSISFPVGVTVLMPILSMLSDTPFFGDIPIFPVGGECYGQGDQASLLVRCHPHGQTRALPVVRGGRP